MLLKSRCNDFSDYDYTSLSLATVNLLQGTTMLVDKTSDLEALHPHFLDHLPVHYLPRYPPYGSGNCSAHRTGHRTAHCLTQFDNQTHRQIEI
ncbi:hypothetical protein LWI28_004044 [Acer negundo]|uniref:Uncharacterized protein n=1 Tax=Acer negundo TaxID=4023 RepID=A0AAD5P224_ACENE|nr:hypothetical protein LWI28_004044 [Acer negundo]